MFLYKKYFSLSSILSIPIMLIGINGGYFPTICRICFKFSARGRYSVQPERIYLFLNYNLPHEPRKIEIYPFKVINNQILQYFSFYLCLCISCTKEDRKLLNSKFIVVLSIALLLIAAKR